MAHPLILDNLALLQSAQELLDGLDDERFGMRQSDGNKSGIGAHLRHVTDHYECLLSALEQDLTRVDYDQRLRSAILEESVEAAKEGIESLLCRLQAVGAHSMHQPLTVGMSTGVASAPECEPFCESSLGRELQFLVSHTVHHFAIMEHFCDAMDLSVPDGFGVAPSTLKFNASR